MAGVNVNAAIAKSGVKMVATTQVGTDISKQPLPWDAFVKKELKRQGHMDDVLDARVEAVLKHILAFRQTVWPTMCRELNKDYGVLCSQSVEPHWVAPAYAVLWQPAYVIEADEAKRTLKRVQTGWEPTVGLPVGNANQLAHWLKKGFRIRPPLQEVEASSVEAAPPSEALGGSFQSEIKEYTCNRHPSKLGRFSGFSTRSWREYRRHCIEHKERLEIEPSWDVKQGMSGQLFICPGCWAGFANERAAQRHYHDYIARRDGLMHYPAKDMAEFARKMREDLAEREAKDG